MNFAMLAQAPANQSIKMVATMTTWEGIAFSSNQKKYLTCKLKDDNGIEHKCRIYEGKGGLPDQNLLNQRLEFSLSWYTGQSQRGQYTGYSGFWNPPQQPQQAPQQAVGRTNSLPTDSGVEIRIKAAEIAATVLSPNQESTDEDFFILSEKIVNYIKNGLIDEGEPQGGPDDDPPW